MEKITQSKLLIYAENLGLKLHTEGNKEIFNSKIPDAWYIDKSQRLLLIFECKQQKSQWKTQAKAQLQEYCNLAKNYADSHNLDIIPVFVHGVDAIELFSIFDFNSPFETEFKELYPTKLERKFNFYPHKFNQYIYDNFPTISSDDKLKLVISVLLTKSQNVNLSPPLFLRVLEVERAYNMEEHFKFISEEPYNKCVDKMFEFFENVPIDKVLDVLYASFVEISKWSFKGISGTTTRKNLTQTEGAVLTPPDIVSLMVELLNIKAADIICDPCCGTGNFLLESLKYTQRIKGNELDLTRSIIAKHGLIISGIMSPEVMNCDCKLSIYTPEFDYLLLNPPYHRNSEQEICIKFIELSKKGGAIIIPSSNFRDDNFMSKIQTICHPLKLIQLNNKVFYPVASVETSVLIYSKIEKEKLPPLQYYDFTDDGYVCDRVEGRTFKEHKEPILTNNSVNILPFNLLELQNKFYIKQKEDEYISYIIQSKTIKWNFYNNIQWLDIKIKELFNYIGKGKTKDIKSTKDGIYPLISRSSTLNGIVKFIDTYDYNGEIKPYFTVAGGGGCGDCFVQNFKFAATAQTSILQLKENKDIITCKKIALLITEQLKLKYNWCNNLNKDNLMNETVKLPTSYDFLNSA